MLCYICELYFKIFKIIKRHLLSVRSGMSTIIFYIIYFYLFSLCGATRFYLVMRKNPTL